MLTLGTEIDARRVGFLHRINLCNNSAMKFLYDVFGRCELRTLLNRYDITGLCSSRRFRFLAFKFFSLIRFLAFCVPFTFSVVLCSFFPVCIVHIAAVMAK